MCWEHCRNASAHEQFGMRKRFTASNLWNRRERGTQIDGVVKGLLVRWQRTLRSKFGIRLKFLNGCKRVSSEVFSGCVGLLTVRYSNRFTAAIHFSCVILLTNDVEYVVFKYALSYPFIHNFSISGVFFILYLDFCTYLSIMMLMCLWLFYLWWSII